MIKFLPSYVGSKKHWIKLLTEFKGMDFVELFCGSAVLSANLANTAILNDLDVNVFNIMSKFDQLIVPELFTKTDYFDSRGLKDWWKYAYCFQKMSFSGVFRYSKNGYNVPIKPNIPHISIRSEYIEALDRWKALSPMVLNLDYSEVAIDNLMGKILILDPPYESSKASYNGKFDYDKYWKFVSEIKGKCKVLVLFDRVINLNLQQIPILSTRKMTVNGAHKGEEEAIAIYTNGKWRVQGLDISLSSALCLSTEESADVQ